MLKKLPLFCNGLIAIASISNIAHASDKKHFPGIFIGATTIESQTDFSYGLEYEYKFADKWGAGVVMENTDNAHEGAGIEVRLASVYFHPIEHLRLGVGVGEEKVNGSHGHPSHEEDLTRVSANWDIPVGDFEIAPTIAFDFVGSETTTVVGIAIIRPF
ncbi:hypothetical protein RGQ13_03175 [Thalassotalea psychrophila]|uniref:Outer membrane protein beta-barrel domain-containing protein n=1 Tax=Thalassotalea psychrophila TaxID=3065647 RepID=A0ABY9TW34_9GAMM|nr:hypothetical protein RGQ13_03175 [Colwelliaceae bacterium SQ149]